MTKTEYALYAPLSAMHPEINLEAFVQSSRIGCPWVGAAAYNGMLANV